MYNNAARTTNEIRSVSAVLLSFSSDGKLNWDHSFKLDEIKMPGIEQVSDFIMKDDLLFFLYKKESDLKLKMVGLQDEAVTENTVKIKTSDPLDEIRSEKEFEGGVRQWLPDTFYVWGYQTVRNLTKEDRVRDVFYINKVVVK